MNIIDVSKSKCKQCYSCIRNCPAKAVKISCGQASVMHTDEKWQPYDLVLICKSHNSYGCHFSYLFFCLRDKKYIFRHTKINWEYSLPKFVQI